MSLTNLEISNRLEEIAKEENFIDQLESLTSFKKEYKTSDFYKKTKLNLFDVYKSFSLYKSLRLESLFDSIQREINKLDLQHLTELLTQFGETMEKENNDVRANFELLKEIMGSKNA